MDGIKLKKNLSCYIIILTGEHLKFIPHIIFKLIEIAFFLLLYLHAYQNEDIDGMLQKYNVVIF